MPALEKKRAPRTKPGNPYTRPEKLAKKKDKPAHATSALPPKRTTRAHLTTGDWLTVFAYVDEHPNDEQSRIVSYFANRKEGALIFTQSTLSRKLKARDAVEQRAKEHPNALSAKKSRVVTRPDVERAVVIFFQNMESRGETVTGTMLMEKRRRIEDLLDVPEEERLKGEGWLRSFCRAYKLKEMRRHGEAGSVDVVAVAAERKRLRAVLAPYALRDQWNLDESGLVVFAIPDRGLASKAMSGKKQNKFRITVCFAVNADGSERMPVIFIGKSKQPRCFKKKTPQSLGFYYRNNKKSWMTSVLFEEWIKMFDAKMRRENRNVILTCDNFSGHFIAYEPRNVTLEYFEPNMTSFIQPLDAGIIRCFKAHYRNAMCIRALDLDDAGEEDIFSLNLLEAMRMVKTAWDKVSSETIANCWKHTGILPSETDITADESNDAPEVHAATSALIERAWDLVREFAISDNIALPAIETSLHELLGTDYVDEHWRPALAAVMAAEGDTEQALDDVNRLSKKSDMTHTSSIPHVQFASTAQLANEEEQLNDHLDELQRRNRLFGKRPTLDEMLNPAAESMIDEGGEKMASDEELVKTAQYQLAVERGEIVEIEEEEEEEEEELTTVSLSEGMDIIQKLEALCIVQGGRDGLVAELRCFRKDLYREIQSNLVQRPLENFFGQADGQMDVD